MDDYAERFRGRGVVVTGGASGIGRAVAQFFSRAGAAVAIVDLDEEALNASAETGEGVPPILGDVSDPAVAAQTIQVLMDHVGRVDIVVNNAGIVRDRVVWKMSDADWRSVLDTHLTGTFNFTRAAIPPMRDAGRGRIINVTSFTGLHGNFGQANYAAAKAGIIGFTKAVAKEVAKFGITVNAVSPNARTAMVASIPETRLEELRSQIPMGRFAEPEEMLAAFSFLASDEAAYVTGIVLPIDGGLSM